ncbi:MAG: septation protein A [Candidatus Nitrotoga sp.]
MKLLFDLFPVIVFFTVFKFHGIFAATATAIAATILQVIWVKFRHGKVDTMLWVNCGIITLFGGATLLLQDENFIKWKPTILYWVFSALLLLSPLLFGKNLLRSMLQEKLALPDKIWGWVNLSWALFFTLMGIVNLYVAFNFPTDVWVNFKLFGATGMMLVFTLLQAIILSKHMTHKEEK